MRCANVRPRVELIVSDALEDHPDAGRLGGRQLVTGEQVALRPFEPEPRHPHPGCLRYAPHARRRVAEPRGLAGDDEVGVEDHVGAAGDAPSLHRGHRRLRDLVQLGERLAEPSDHLHVGHRVPHAGGRSAAAGPAVDQSSPNPAQNARPSAASNTTLTLVSRSASSKAVSSSSRSCGVMVLNSSGRHRTSFLTAPYSSVRIALPIQEVQRVGRTP